MINVTKLPDAWEQIERLGGDEASAKDKLYYIYYKISTALFDYRLKYDLSQKKLADKLGVTQPMVAKLESGDYNYTVEQLWKIALKLNFKLNIEFLELKQEEYTVFSQEEYEDEIDYEIGYLAVGS